MALMEQDALQAAQASDLEQVWRQRIVDAQADRKLVEPDWHEALYFAAGRHWYQWSRTERRMLMPQSLLAQEAELYTADRITEYRMTVLGEMTSDDDRPELLLVRDDQWSEDYQKAANRAVSHAWEHEWDAEQALASVYQLMVDLGTAAMWCCWDPSYGRVVQQNLPHHQGRPVYDVAQAAQLMDQGAPLTFKDVREGRTVWRPLTPFHLLPPPGIPHERDFPYEIIVRPVPVDDIKAMYPAAAGVTEDTDIGSLIGLSASSASGSAFEGVKQRVKDHAWLYTINVRPTARYEKGRTLTFVNSDKKLVDVKDELAYQGPDGQWRSGVSYFHWWRVTGRFWSRGMVQAMEDAQRRINERLTQNGKIIRRGMPKTFLQKGSLVDWPQGLPMEVVTLKDQAAPPNFFQGLGPGAWMQADVEQADQDIAHATGVYGPTRGENPANVSTYSQLALIAENDQTKRKPIYRDAKLNIKTLVENGVYDIVRYWPPDKKIMVTEDDENIVSADIFNKSQLGRSFYIVQVANGAAKPRSQGAMLQLVNDIWNASVAAAAPLPIDWYKRSLEAGQPLDLPEQPASQQAHIAELENHMLQAGLPVKVAYYDAIDVHVPRHRLQQDQARAVGDNQTVGLIEQHIQEHLAMAQQNAADTAANGPGAQPQGAPMPPGPPPANGAAPSPAQASGPQPRPPLQPPAGP